MLPREAFSPWHHVCPVVMVLVLASRWVMTSRCSFNSMWMYETACANEVRTVVHPLPSSGRATYVAPAMPRIGGETDLNPTKRGNQ